MTRLWDGGFGVRISAQTSDFSLHQTPRPLIAPTLSSLIKLESWTPFVEVNRAGRDADHSLPPGADVKNEWSHTSSSLPPYTVMPCTRQFEGFKCVWPEAVEKYYNFHRVRRWEFLQLVEKLPSFYRKSTVHHRGHNRMNWCTCPANAGHKGKKRRRRSTSSVMLRCVVGQIFWHNSSKSTTRTNCCSVFTSNNRKTTRRWKHRNELVAAKNTTI